MPVRSPTDTGTIRVLIDGENLPCYRMQCKNCDLDGTGRCVAIKGQTGQSSPNTIAIFIIVFVIAVVYFPTVVGTGLGILIIMGIFALPFVVFYLLSMIAALAVSGVQDFEEYKRQGRF